MNIIFLTLLDFNSFDERNIYTDLLREFIKHGHDVYCISPAERRSGIHTHFEENGHLLKLRIGNTQKTNLLEKGISTLMIETQFINAIKKYFAGVKFDLVLYSTPPITFANAIRYVKKRDEAKTYLMLKDIFPQNAVDLGMLSLHGWKSLLYRYFRHKEKVLYALSERIGCMSEANVEYILKYNPDISKENVEVCPNAVEPRNLSPSKEEIKTMRLKYGIPLDKKILVYGGNLGKPQGISFLIDCLRMQKDCSNVYFLIVGDGTEYEKLKDFIETEKQSNVKLMSRLPKEDYDRMIAACDIGLIFLDHRFTIPNFPSRLLSYMQARLPVLACTDPNTDIGKVIVDGGFGWWCESNDVAAFSDIVKNIDTAKLETYGNRAFDYLENHYTSERAYKIIMKE